jgi:hypothetical protein
MRINTRARRGAVTIQGKPLHGPPARFAVDVSVAGYGPTGFVPSALEFGRSGCWLLRAHLAGHVLTLVIYVRPVSG